MQHYFLYIFKTSLFSIFLTGYYFSYIIIFIYYCLSYIILYIIFFYLLLFFTHYYFLYYYLSYYYFLYIIFLHIIISQNYNLIILCEYLFYLKKVF